jgi:hypothetical protein
LLCAGLFAGCTGRASRNLEAAPGEVVVVGRIHAYEHGVEVSPEIRLLFNQSAGTFHRTLAPRDSGHFVLRLPRGHNWIAHLEYRNRSVTFPGDYATLDLTGPETIHYAGDIRVTFAFDHMKPAGGSAAGLGAMGGAVGYAAGAALDIAARDTRGPSDFIPVLFEVSSDTAAARAFLRRAHKVDGAWNQSPLKVKDGPRVEREILEEAEESE